MSKGLLIVLSNCLLILPSLMAQKSCPKLVVVPDVLDVAAGKPANFTVFASTSAPGWQSLDNKTTINWMVSSGTIDAGQGTNTISVNTTGLELHSSITASAEVGGLPAPCPSFISSTISIMKDHGSSSWYEIKICMVQNGKPVEQMTYYHPIYGDTMVVKDNKRLLFCEAFKDQTAGYALTKKWYTSGTDITLNKVKYQIYGLPRILTVWDVQKAGEYDGVTLFTEQSATGIPDVIYVPVRIGCEFQPYHKLAN